MTRSALPAFVTSALRGWWRRSLAAALPPTVRRALRLHQDLVRGEFLPALVAAPTGRHVCVLAPHADDETFGCGATLALAARAGCQVTVLVLTDGRKGYAAAEVARMDDAQRSTFETALAARRVAEAGQACAALGLPAPLLLNLPDGQLFNASPTQQRHQAAALAQALAQCGPDLVLAPFASDAHPDHMATARLLCTAAPAAGLPADTEVWAYETWTPLVANAFVDVGAAWPAKRLAMAAYASQTSDTDYPRAFEALAAYRALAAGRSNSLVEAFHRSTLQGYGTQVAGMSQG